VTTLHILTLGEILIDLFPAQIGTPLAQVSAFHPKPGGAPANVAVAARRLGAATAFIGKVGDDAFGRHLIDVLQQQKVGVQGMRVDPQARTTLAFIAMPDEHTAEFVFYRNPGADLQLYPDELDRSLIERARALHTGSLGLVDEPCRSAVMQAVEWARQAGSLVSFDVNYRPSLWPGPQQALEQIRSLLPLAHLLKVNEAELVLLTGSQDPAAARQLLDLGPELVILTLGSRGSFYAAQGLWGFIPAFPVPTVDATGCGDSFIAALLVCLTQGPDWRKSLNFAFLEGALRFASAAAAITAQTQGVIPALPDAGQVEQFLALHGQTQEHG
jgi:fructokinase